jgi:hypothetical protein
MWQNDSMTPSPSDFVCNPEKREQIIEDVKKRKAKLSEDAGLCRIEA